MELQAFVAGIVRGTIPFEEAEEVASVLLVEEILRLVLDLQATYGVDVLRAEGTIQVVACDAEGNSGAEREELGDEVKNLGR